MVQNNRQLIRLFFILVIFAASLGWWYATAFWQFDTSTLLGASSADGEGDGAWVDVMASLAEQMLLLFLDLASPDG